MQTQQFTCVNYGKNPKHPQLLVWEKFTKVNCVLDLVSFIDKEPEYFPILAYVMREYRNPDIDPQTAKEREENILRMVRIHRNVKVKVDQTNEFIRLMDVFYSASQGSVSDLRGDMIEAIIHKFGPRNFSETSNTAKHIEPVIMYNGQVIGGNNCDFDFIYHDDHATSYDHVDYFECKATLDGYINDKIPMSCLPSKKLKKWDYAKTVRQYFEQNTQYRPKIHFASFIAETNQYQSYLVRNGYGCIELLSTEMLLQMIKNSTNFQ